MKKFYILTALIFAVLSSHAMATVPTVEIRGVPAITVCPTSAVAGIPATAYHSDKIVFSIVGTLVAAATGDQAKLAALPFNTELDIKVQDDPTQVADIKSKVLTFLGATLTPQNAQLIKIISVEYAIAVCPKSP